MIGPELAMAATLVDLFVGRDTFEAPDAMRELSAILMDLDDAEATVLPASFGRALEFLSADVPRWRAAADAAVRLDLHECVPSLVRGLQQIADPHQVANTASLLVSPSIDERTRATTQSFLLGMSSHEDLRRLLRVRLDDAPVSREAEQVLHAQMWPGLHSPRELARVAPIVYVAEAGAPTADLWRVIAAVASTGVRVRRLADLTQAEFMHASWASVAYPVVAWSGLARSQWSRITASSKGKFVMVPAHLDTRLSLPRIVNHVLRLLPPGVEAISPPTEFGEKAAAFSVDTLHEGAFDALDMMYLGAAGRSTLQALSKSGLTPVGADTPRWQFNQLVTMRLIQGFKARGAKFREAPVSLLERIRDIAEAAEKTQVAIDANGKLYLDEGDGFRTLEGNQETLPPVLEIDFAFQSFELGGGRVPALLRPGTQTDVDPRVLGGSPSIRDRRIPARTLAEVEATKGMNVLRSAYPELRGPEIADGLGVGRAIMSQRKTA